MRPADTQEAEIFLSELHKVAAATHKISNSLPEKNGSWLEKFSVGVHIPSAINSNDSVHPKAIDFTIASAKGAWNKYQKEVLECAHRILEQSLPRETIEAEMETILNFANTHGVNPKNQDKLSRLDERWKAYVTPQVTKRHKRPLTHADAISRWEEEKDDDHEVPPNHTSKPSMPAYNRITSRRSKDQYRKFPFPDDESIQSR